MDQELAKMIEQLRTKMKQPKVKIKLKGVDGEPPKLVPFKLAQFWNLKFAQVTELPPGVITGAQLKICSLLIASYEEQLIYKMLSWFLGNYSTLNNYSGAPSLEGLWGYRATVLMNMQKAEKPIAPKDDLGIAEF